MGQCFCCGHHEFETTDDIIISDKMDLKEMDIELDDRTIINQTAGSSSSEDNHPSVYRIRRIGKGDTSSTIILPF